MTLSVYDSDLRLVTQVDEGTILWIVAAVRGGNPTTDVVTISVDANFNGSFEATERRVLFQPNTVNGFYSIYLSVPDDGPSPGNATPSDQLRIRAQVNDIEKTANLTVNNVAPVIVATPVVTRTIDSTSQETITVHVTYADPGQFDRHTALVIWSDGSVTTSDFSWPENNQCFGVAIRAIDVAYLLPRGSRVVPISVTISDDDGASGSGSGSDMIDAYHFEYLDVAVNRDDDNRSRVADLAEWPVSGEDDVRPADLSPLLQSHMTAANGSFLFTYNTNAIRVWDSADKRNMIRPTSSGIATISSPPAIPSIAYTGQRTVFVEGLLPGLASLNVSWQPKQAPPLWPMTRCQLNSRAFDGGSLFVSVWDIDVDIDSDNNDGTRPPLRTDNEEFLEENPFGIGKMIYTDEPAFTPVIVNLPSGLDRNDSRITIGIDFKSVGSSSGSVKIYTTPRNASNFNSNNVLQRGDYSLAQLGYSGAGTITLYLQADNWTKANETKEDVDKNGKTDDRLLVTIKTPTLEVTDTVKWMVVGPQSYTPPGGGPSLALGTFFPTLQNSRPLRSAGAAEAVYKPDSYQDFTLRMLSHEEVRELLERGGIPRVEIDLAIRDMGGIWSGVGRPPANLATIRLYLDHVSLNYILSFKGTDMFEIDDWLDNIQNNITGTSEKYIQAMHVARVLWNAGIPFHNAGHSLGGGLATAASMATATEADTFNAAGLNPQELYYKGYWEGASRVPFYPETPYARALSDRLIKAYNVYTVRPPSDFPYYNTNSSSDYSEDARDALTFFQHLLYTQKRPDDPRIPAAFEAWGESKSIEGLFDLTKAEALALRSLASGVNAAFAGTWITVLKDLLWALPSISSLMQKMQDSHSFPSVYYGLLHNRDGWNAFDHTARKF